MVSWNIFVILIIATLSQARLHLDKEAEQIGLEISALKDMGDSYNFPSLVRNYYKIPKLIRDAKNCLKANINPCQKLMHADKIFQTFNGHERAIAVARKLIAAEQETDPCVTKYPIVCADPSLPQALALRGVIPMVDPDVPKAAVENQNSARSVLTPFPADSYSVGMVMFKQGFENFGAVMSDGRIVVLAPNKFEEKKACRNRHSSK
ncbi:hypothetical protein K3495_g5396 [Podosphaera aphanis]|nr:hypothetical protein K3495_g5396 [Podosphaera aphanis]